MYVFEFDLSLVSLNDLKLSKSRTILSRINHNQIKQWFYQSSHHLQHKHTSTVLEKGKYPPNIPPSFSKSKSEKLLTLKA